MRRLAFAVFVVVAIAAPAAAASETSAKLLAMAEAARHAELTEMVKPSGEPCDAVVRAEHVKDDAGRTWHVACRDGNEYILGITDGAKVHTAVMSCADIKLLSTAIARRDASAKVAECWKN